MQDADLADMFSQDKYGYVSAKNKAFMAAFDAEMEALGYTSVGTIGNGYCWGRHMVIYTRAGRKDKPCHARVYMREGGILLRLYLSKIDAHKAYIESAPEYIRSPFIDGHGTCTHCRDSRQQDCKFRKTYYMGGRQIEKCNGITFEFREPDMEKLPGYISLLKEFYPPRGTRPTGT